MTAVYYRCYACGEIFSTKEGAGQHVSSCSKVPRNQELSNSTESEAQEQLLENENKSQESDQLLTKEDTTCEPAATRSGEGTDEKTVFVWNRAATLLLIKLYDQHEDKFNSFSFKKQVWQLITKEVRAAGYNVTKLQCENRWKTLMSAYRKTKFINQLSGACRKKTCNFFKELDDIVRGKRVPVRKQRRGGKEGAEAASESNGRPGLQRNEVDPLCEILQTMEERAEKRHRERMQMQRELIDSHKLFMDNILQILKSESAKPAS